ncbi:hypothetical protein ES708_26194 [subsurface metagenome]
MSYPSESFIAVSYPPVVALASKTTTNVYDGEVLRVVFGANATTGGYETAINDSDGYDILEGGGSTCSSGGSQLGVGDSYCPYSAVSSKLKLSISGASAISTGQTIIYIR